MRLDVTRPPQLWRTLAVVLLCLAADGCATAHAQTLTSRGTRGSAAPPVLILRLELLNNRVVATSNCGSQGKLFDEVGQSCSFAPPPSYQWTPGPDSRLALQSFPDAAWDFSPLSMTGAQGPSCDHDVCWPPPPPIPSFVDNGGDGGGSSGGGGGSSGGTGVFNATNYLLANPDVALAIAMAKPGDYWYSHTAEDHYNEWGIIEGRTPDGSYGTIDTPLFQNNGVTRASDPNENLKMAHHLLTEDTTELRQYDSDNPWLEENRGWASSTTLDSGAGYSTSDGSCVVNSNGGQSCSGQ